MSLLEEEKRWYVVHTYSGYEQKVKANLEKRLESMNMEDKIFQVIVPMEDEMQFKGGKRKTVKRKIYPGYILVEMILDDDSWYVVRNTPGVTGFVGVGNKPLPLEEEEAQKILNQMGLGESVPRIDLNVGETVRIKSGPFENFVGTVAEIYPEKGKLKVMVSMFGRDTPVELDFGQIEKMN